MKTESSNTENSGSPPCYLAIAKSGEIVQDDSAAKIAAAMWGRSAKEWTFYKRVAWKSGDVTDLRDLLEAR